MGTLVTWIAARLGRIGAAFFAGVVALWAILRVLAGIRKSGYRAGKEDAQDAHNQQRLKQALKESQDYEEKRQAMDDASARGPRSRDDVLDRLRDGED